MAHNSHNPERSIEPSDYQRPTSWVNYGDVNPEPHGGMFIMWDNDMWSIVKTYPAKDMLPDWDDDGHVVFEMLVEPQDIWVKGQPERGFTSQMEKAMNTLTATRRTGPTDPELFENMGYYVGLMDGWVDSDMTIVEDADSYDDVLADFGVEEWE